MKTKYRKTLAGKISIGINIPFVLIIAVMGLISSLLLDSELSGMADQNRANTLQYSVQMIENEVNGAVKNYLRAIAEKNRELMASYYEKAVAGELTEEEAYVQISDILLHPEYGKIGTTGYLAGVNSKGILSIHPKSQGADASGHEFMQKAMAMRNGYLEYEWQNVGEDAPRMKAGYLSYFEPWDIMVWASSYKAEFLSLVDLAHIRKIIDSMRVGTDGFLMLVSGNGALLAGEEQFQALWDNDGSSSGQRGSILSEILQRIAAQDAGSYQYESGSGNVNILYDTIPALGWKVVVNDPTREYMRVVQTFRLVLVFTILLASVAVSIFIRVLMQKMLSPVQVMRNVSTQISEGDLSKRLSVTTADEMGEIARIFNGVIEAFSMLVEHIQDASGFLMESTHNLGASAQEISSTANQQAAAVKEILSTMEDSDKLSKGVAVKILEVVKIATSTKELVENGFSLIKQSLDKMNEIRETNSNTIGGIKVLGNQIDSIWEVVNIINGIADQTKIIAFNAELEAASAGEAGRNFQIVASEIRRLADNTVDSTNEIKTNITEIQHASDKLIIASEEGTQRIREGWDISHNIRSIFEEVLSSSEISASSAEDISRSIRMQVSSFEQIFLTLKQISEGINNFVVSTHSTSEASDQLKDIADQFKDSIDKYSLGSDEELSNNG